MRLHSLMDLNGFFLRCCPYMAGMKEAWHIDNIVLVSPAVFQLLTDQDDLKTLYTVANQLTLKTVTSTMLRALVAKKWNSVTSHDDGNLTVYFRIEKVRAT